MDEMKVPLTHGVADLGLGGGMSFKIFKAVSCVYIEEG